MDGGCRRRSALNQFGVDARRENPYPVAPVPGSQDGSAKVVDIHMPGEGFRDRVTARADADAIHAARWTLVAFLFTFVAARMLVFLIMSRTIPNFYVYLGGTHIHHLNFGIVLLSLVGAWLLFRRPRGKQMSLAAAVYGIGLALTFDEFGMWLHLGGNYWQRASFDAVVVVAAILGLIAFAPAIERFRPHHWVTAVLLALAVSAFAYGLVVSLRYAGQRMSPMIHRIEQTNPESQPAREPGRPSFPRSRP
jgi:hypothetical protein